MSERPIVKGDLVRTRKGANFSGVVVVLYDSLGGYPHAVVEAVEPGFEDTEHLYPLVNQQAYRRAMVEQRRLKPADFPIGNRAARRRANSRKAKEGPL